MEHVIAETLSGKVRGIVNNGISVFKGMPYGGRADGEARFAPPSKPESWAGVRDAFEFGARWRFTTEDARITLEKRYPVFEYPDPH